MNAERIGLVLFEDNVHGSPSCFRSGQRWAHVSCALWIPEISFGDADLVEPITNIAGVPVSPSWLFYTYILFSIRVS